MLTIPAGADFILRRLMENGFDAYVVGGCVRDSLLGLFPHDWDICTSARPEQMQAVFADCRVIETGLKHGTLTVLHDRIPYEVTTFRVDGGYTDHRHPDSVSFVSNVVDDLARRDFTVNAMAWNPQTGLVDAFHGQEDLRALRFASVYGFRIDDATSQAAHDLRNTLTDVAAERIRIELAKLLCGQGAADILRAYPDVVFVLLPQLRAMHGFDQHNPHHRYDVWEHTLRALPIFRRRRRCGWRFCCMTAASRTASRWMRRASGICTDTRSVPPRLRTRCFPPCVWTTRPASA